MRTPKRLLPRSSYLPPVAVVRVFLLAMIGVIGSAWALVRFYTHPHEPMLVTVPAYGASASDAGASDASEIPAPDLEVLPR